MSEIHGKYGDELKCTPFSANTAGRCIENVARDLKKWVSEQITQCGKSALWLGESTDASNMSQLMGFARFCFSNERQE